MKKFEKFGLNAARTDSFRACRAHIFVKGQLSKDWRKTNRYTLKTRLFQPIKLIELQNYPNRFLTKDDKSKATVEVKLFLTSKRAYSFSFNLSTGNFLEERKPPGLSLRWEGRYQRVLLLEAEEKIFRVVPIRNWFKKPLENKYDVDIENSARVIGFHGDVKLSKWVMREGDLSLSPARLKKGLTLEPGNVLHVGEASSIKVKLDSGVLRTFTENTLVDFRRKTLVLGVTQAASIKLQDGAPPGSIGIYRSDGYHPVPLNQEIPIVLGDVIQTGPDGRGEVVLADEKRIVINSFTTIWVEHPEKSSLLSSVINESEAIYEGN